MHVSKQSRAIERKLNKLLAKQGEKEELLELIEQLDESTDTLEKAVKENQPPNDVPPTRNQNQNRK